MKIVINSEREKKEGDDKNQLIYFLFINNSNADKSSLFF